MMYFLSLILFMCCIACIGLPVLYNP
jgi:hypothetical protein